MLRVSDFLAQNSFFIEPACAYVMNKPASLDIDDAQDFAYASCLMGLARCPPPKGRLMDIFRKSWSRVEGNNARLLASPPSGGHAVKIFFLKILRTLLPGSIHSFHYL